MTDRPVLYIRAGRHPKDWRSYNVTHANGRVIPDVIEADALNGWFVQAVRDKAGQVERHASGRMMTRRVQAKIKIVRRDQA